MPNPPHWPNPHRLPGPTGLGGISDFNAYVQADPHFAAAWGDVQAQLQAEGATVLVGAQTAFSDAFSQLSSSSFGIPISPDQVGNVYDTAKKYVMTGQTILGSVNTILGMIQTGPKTIQAALADVQSFTGTMIGLLTVTGVATAGIGAAIVAGVGTIVGALEALIGNPPPPPSAGYTACGLALHQKPDWTVGCIAAWGVVNQPNTKQWRVMPDPNNAADASWFAVGQIGASNWNGAFFGWRSPGEAQDYPPTVEELNASNFNPNALADTMTGPDGTGTIDTGAQGIVNQLFGQQGQATVRQGRPIDWAFPGNWQGTNGYSISTYQMVVEQGANLNAGDFQNAFITAWKANASYALNGLQPQPDFVVLAHLIRTWNRCHVDNGSPAVIPRGSGQYMPSLVDQALRTSPFSDITTPDGNSFVINAGPRITPGVTAGAANVVRLSIGGGSKSTLLPKVAAGVAIAAGGTVLATVGYAYVKHKTVSGVFGGLWRAVVRR